MYCFKSKLVDLICDENNSRNGFIIFDDNYGFTSIKLRDIIFSLSDKTERDDSEVYCKWEDKFLPVASNLDNLIWLVNEYDWDSDSLYVHNKSKFGESLDSLPNKLEKGYEKNIKVKAISFVFAKYPCDSGYYYGSNDSFELKFNSKKEMIEYSVYCIQNYNSNELVKPLLQEIKEGMMLYSDMFCSAVKVIKVYEYPSNNGFICRVQKINNSDKNVDINYNRDGLYYLPYERIKTNKYESLNYTFNEIELMPHIEFKNGVYNIYWKKMDDAANYIISMYKVLINYGDKEIYHLKDFIIGRNECVLAVDNIVGDNFFFKICVENRKGEKIAISRVLWPKRGQIPTYIDSI